MTEAVSIATEMRSSTTLSTTISGSSKIDKMLNATITQSIELEDLTTIHFEWYDYLFFSLLLGVSVVIGLYYAFFSKHKQNNTEEYILGGKTMKTWPVAISLVSAHISGTTLLGLPSEVYEHGTQYIAFFLAAFCLALTLIYIYIPLFYDLQLTSSFQYLERRFDRHVRLLGSIIYSTLIILHVPIVIYIPALAFNQVTGYNLYIVTLLTCSICVFYTTIGGLRAVVWTDFLQFLVALGALFSIIYLGTKDVGGVSNVFETAERGGRIIVFNLDPNPLVRTSFWSVGIGMSVVWVSALGVSQSSIQRFLSVPDLRAARRSVWIFVGGMILIKLCAIYLGLLIYAKYAHCDPVKSGIIEKPDQIVPFYVLDVGRQVPGLSGLFIAGIFAGGMSAMSASLNSLAGTVYEDFLKPHLPKATEEQASNYMKMIVVVAGLIVTCTVFLIEKMGAVFQASLSLAGVTSGAQLGIFTLGMTCRTVNTKGILTGAITSLLAVATVLIGAQLNHVAKDSTLPISVDKCEYIFPSINETVSNTMTSNTHPLVEQDEILWVFRISFWYYGLLGFVITFVVSYVVSLLTGGYDDELDESLLSPMFRSQRYKDQMKQNNAEYKDIDTALNVLRQTNHE